VLALYDPKFELELPHRTSSLELGVAYNSKYEKDQGHTFSTWIHGIRYVTLT